MQESHPHEVYTSIWPLILGLGISMMIIGIVIHIAVSAIGVALTLYALWGWTQENRRLSALAEAHEAAALDVVEEAHEH